MLFRGRDLANALFVSRVHWTSPKSPTHLLLLNWPVWCTSGVSGVRNETVTTGVPQTKRPWLETLSSPSGGWKRDLGDLNTMRMWDADENRRRGGGGMFTPSCAAIIGLIAMALCVFFAVYLDASTGWWMDRENETDEVITHYGGGFLFHLFKEGEDRSTDATKVTRKPDSAHCCRTTTLPRRNTPN